MKLNKIQQKSRNQHQLDTPICHHYQKGLAGFCIHCHKLQHQHSLIKHPKRQPIINIKPIINPIIKPINDNDWIFI